MKKGTLPFPAAYYLSYIITQAAVDVRFYRELSEFENQLLDLSDSTIMHGFSNPQEAMVWFGENKDRPNVHVECSDKLYKYLQSSIYKVSVPMWAKQYIIPILDFLEL